MTTPSFIAILDFSTTAADRPTAIAQLEREQPVVSAMPGCVAFRAFSSRDDDTGITVLHEWIDQASFADYLASDPHSSCADRRAGRVSCFAR